MKVRIRKNTALGRIAKGSAVIAALFVALFFAAGCELNTPVDQALKEAQARQYLQEAAPSASLVPLGSASTFAVMGYAGVTNAGASVITGDLGVGPGAIEATGFDLTANTIVGPGTVTAGLGMVSGTIYVGDPTALQAHDDAVIAYNYLQAQVPDTIFGAVHPLDGLTFTPGIYNFPSSANLQVNGTVYLDFQGNNDALFIFQFGSTLVTMANSKVIALNTSGDTCIGSNVYWAVGSSATIDGSEFIGSVIAYTAITMTSAANIPPVSNVAGRMFALGASVTMVDSNIAVCAGSGPPPPDPSECDSVKGSGHIKSRSIGWGHKYDKASFSVFAGIKDEELWGRFEFQDQAKRGIRVKSTSVTAYTIVDAVTRQIEGTALVNGRTSVTYKIVLVDNGKPYHRYGRSNDSFSMELSNGYTISGTLQGGDIQIFDTCDPSHDCDGHGHDCHGNNGHGGCSHGYDRK